MVRKSKEVPNAKGVLLLILNADSRQFEPAAACGMDTESEPVPHNIDHIIEKLEPSWS